MVRGLMTGAVSGICWASLCLVAWPQTETSDVQEYRTWTDSTGRHTTEAVMIDFARGEVHLQKRDGQIVRLTIGKLSKADQKFVREEVARRKDAGASRSGRKKPSESSESDWPGWLGTKRDGKSPDTGLLTAWPEGGPAMLWKASGIGQGFSTVAVVDGLVYTTGATDGQLVLFAFDLRGELVWKVAHGPAHDKSYPGSRSTPMIDEGNLYIVSGNGLVGCYDAKTGQGKWSHQLAEFGGTVPEWGYAESVLIYKQLAIVTPGGSRCLVALDKRTGRPVWSSQGFAAGAQYGSCYAFEYQGQPMVVTGTTEGLVCVDPDSGRLLWSNPFSAHNTANCPTPAFADGYVFWANGYGQGGICLKLDVRGKSVTATEAWTTREMDCHHGGYIIHEGYIYGNHGPTWVCLDLKTGEQKWQERAVGKGSLCFADGMLYLFSENGGRAGLATCSPEGLEMRGTFRVDGQEASWAHPVVIGGRLYLRYDDNLYCFDVRASAMP